MLTLLPRMQLALASTRLSKQLAMPPNTPQILPTVPRTQLISLLAMQQTTKASLTRSRTLSPASPMMLQQLETRPTTTRALASTLLLSMLLGQTTRQAQLLVMLLSMPRTPSTQQKTQLVNLLAMPAIQLRASRAAFGTRSRTLLLVTQMMLPMLVKQLESM